MATLCSDNLFIETNGGFILTDVSVTFSSGELVGIIGPNGAGKTTLLKGLLGLLKPTSGEITLDGKSLDSWSRKEIAKRIGYIAQGAPCHWPMTVEKIIEIGLTPHSPPLWGTNIKDRDIIEEAMQVTGVSHLRHRIVTSLSGGERTLVMVARCLAGRTEILLADEPLTGLDPRHQVQIIETLINTATNNTGVVIILHDLSLAARYCKRLILVKDGHIAADGEPELVLTSKNLLDVYGINASLRKIDGHVLVVPRDGRN